MANVDRQAQPTQAVVSPLQNFIDALWRGGANAIGQMREEIVDRGWFGRHPMPTLGEPDRGSIWGPATDKAVEDPMGRTAEGPAPLSSDDRYGFGQAYTRHLEAGPAGTIEMQNYWDFAEREGQTCDGPESYDKAIENEMKRDEMER